MAQENRVLLPQQLKPVKYDIELKPDLVNFTFEGKLSLQVQVAEVTNHVQLHSREIGYQTATFTNNGETQEAVAINFNCKKQIVDFVFDKDFAVGEGTLVVEYSGILNNQMAGFYRSTYTDIDGKKKIMASTQFESLDARRAFPCWDEPAAKAIFELTLVIDANLTALSNMPEASIKSLPNGKKKVAFLPSVKMSTYLLAFVVGEFDFVATVTDHGVPIRCFSTPGMSHRCEFALDCAKRCLDLYDDYFKVPYPLPKLDMIAIPEFAAGAMENWGLVTYREVDLLVDPVTASASQRQRVCTVVTHELAHQWFGNLVTMAWWSGLWLNESFACFMQTWSADILFPEWKMWDQFINDDLAAALRLDALRSSHPIQVPINEAVEVEEVFDAISYCKGATVVRMLNAVIGPEAFQQGLVDYFNKHQYANTEGSDLWEAWTNACGKDIGGIARSWTEQMGYPIIKAESVAKDGKVALKLRQSWFMGDGSEVKPEEEKTWQLPLLISCKSQPEPKLVIVDNAESEVVVEGAAVGDWININAGHVTPARVEYSEELLKAIKTAVENGTLPVADRAGLVLDYYAFAKANGDGADLIRLLSAYKTESSPIVWDALSTVFAALHKIVMDDPVLEPKVRALFAPAIENCFKGLGWDPKPDDEHLTTMHRADIISMLSRFSDSDEVFAEAQRRFEAVVDNVNDTEACPTDYRVAVFKMAMKRGDATTFEQLMDIYRRCDNDAQRKHVMHALGSASFKALKIRVLDWTTTEVKLQDFFYPILSVSSSSSEGQQVAWDYFTANFDRLKAKLAKANPSLMHAVIVYSARGFVAKDKIDQVEAFLKAHPIPGVERGVSQMLEGMRTVSEFAARMSKGPMAKDEFWKSL
eukprot:TRINITY_DN7298_c0_g1_i2.p1 TRINITY_DN7298_c0_g1~~TRINITY_DN7298_c0_g1_i2.p1  ORF type:complete len:872 (+),score=286.73 TRINITY_DN7298_c0_g1_i2:3-2618(+)